MIRILTMVMALYLLLIGSLFAGDVKIEVVTLGGGRHIDLGVLKSIEEDGGPVTDLFSKEIKLRITNTGSKRYIVSQRLDAPPMSDRGIQFDQGHIRCHVLLNSGTGIVRVPAPTSLGFGTQELFLSNENGEDTELIVIYDFWLPPFKEAGRYQTSITYEVRTT
jgi:hypothetical protein